MCPAWPWATARPDLGRSGQPRDARSRSSALSPTRRSRLGPITSHKHAFEPRDTQWPPTGARRDSRACSVTPEVEPVGWAPPRASLQHLERRQHNQASSIRRSGGEFTYKRRSGGRAGSRTPHRSRMPRAPSAPRLSTSRRHSASGPPHVIITC